MCCFIWQQILISYWLVWNYWNIKLPDCQNWWFIVLLLGYCIISVGDYTPLTQLIKIPLHLNVYKARFLSDMTFWYFNFFRVSCLYYMWQIKSFIQHQRGHSKTLWKSCVLCLIYLMYLMHLISVCLIQTIYHIIYYLFITIYLFIYYRNVL